MSSRTLERYVQQRAIPCIVYAPARGGPDTTKPRPMIAFDPAEIIAWRDAHKVGQRRAS
ncbi:MAG TPA: hypothetical protein VF102_01355 [Gemmatimonadaceae bacterium]